MKKILPQPEFKPGEEVVYLFENEVRTGTIRYIDMRWYKYKEKEEISVTIEMYCIDSVNGKCNEVACAWVAMNEKDLIKKLKKR